MTPPVGHAERLRDMAANWLDYPATVQHRPQDTDVCLAGAAALDEVATLRAERDEIRAQQIAYQHAAERQLGELRARVQQLEQALRTIEEHHAVLNDQHGRDQGRSHTLSIARAALGTTPPGGERDGR